MKKLFVAILTLVYVSSVAGASVYMHFCQSYLGDKCSVLQKTKNCNTALFNYDHKDEDCCKVKNKYCKSPTNQHPVVTVYNLKQPLAATLPFSFYGLNTLDKFTIVTNNLLNHASPENSRVALYIRNCVFRL